MAFGSEVIALVGLMTFGLDQTFALRDGGELHVDDAGLSLRSKKHGVQVWTYEHLQEVKLEPSRMRIVTYEDGPRWKFGADRGAEFELARGSFAGLDSFLREKLDRRLVTAMAEVPNDAEWSVAVKRVGTVKGSEGTLYVAKDRVVYLSAVPGESRTWRLQDIDNVNSSGMYELTLTTYERARMSYGSMRSLNFRLKQPIDAARVDALWRRLQRPRS